MRGKSEVCAPFGSSGNKMKGRLRIHGPIGVALFCLAAIMLGEGREPFATYFYSFAWWSYILAADALVYWVRGESLMMNRTRSFLIMIPLSIFIWCIIEGFNFRLANWHYIILPPAFWQRWIGYAVAYGTVLPGLCETAHLLQATRYFRAVSIKRWRPSLRSLNLMISAGGACLLAPLLIPRYCFPLVWIGFALILEPLLYRSGNDSLLNDIEHGNLTRLLTLLIGGLICGFLWEAWNFWAQAKWIYTVPFFEKLKLFEMPLLGFLGFSPFAVSAYAMYRIILVVMQRSSIVMKSTQWFFITVFCLLCFAGIDRSTVVSYIPLIRDLTGVPGALKERLQEAGVKRAQDLIRTGASGLVHIGIPQAEAEELIRKAEMITLKGMGVENYRLLREAGVEDIPELARQDSELLNQRLSAISPLPHAHRIPDPALVRLWVSEAQKEVSLGVKDTRIQGFK
jgi:hypothetical protein